MKFSAKKFDELWSALPEKTRQAIRWQAQFWSMSLGKVMRIFHPDLWDKIKWQDERELGVQRN